MTQREILSALETFRCTIERLSSEYPDDRDFWPAYAEHANRLEANCPHDIRDYVRSSILRTMDTISRTRN
jgi:hypothetical protein